MTRCDTGVGHGLSSSAWTEHAHECECAHGSWHECEASRMEIRGRGRSDGSQTPFVVSFRLAVAGGGRRVSLQRLAAHVWACSAAGHTCDKQPTLKLLFGELPVPLCSIAQRYVQYRLSFSPLSP
eukprot:357488-Chlamydomonas_euryale.AAC.4